MIQWLNNRLWSRSNSKLEEAPTTSSTRPAYCGASPRRGATKRPLGMVRLQNRRCNQIARASRRANRSSR